MKQFIKYCKENQNYAIWIFSIFFIFYIFLGLCISCWPTTSENIFFNADNGRAFGDLTNITYNHYRIKVHPLFLLLAETATLLINGIVNNPALAVICIESFCGAMSVSLFYSILFQKNVEKYIRIIFSFIYGLSFSSILFSTIPETFIFAGLGLITYWYFLANVSDTKQQLGIRIYLLIVFFGIVSIGITLTNYIFYLVGLVYLLLCKYSFKNGVKKFLSINLLNGLVILICCKFQKFIWKAAPLFWESILAGLRGEAYEETVYMGWDISWGKTNFWIKSSLLRPLLAPEVYWKSYDNGVHQTLFNGYHNWGKIVLFLFFLTCITSIIIMLIRIFKKFDFKEHGYFFSLILSFGGNLLLHYIYGKGEGFLYSAHYWFLPLLISAIAINGIPNRKIKIGLQIWFSLFCLAQGINNIYRFFQTAKLTLAYANVPLSLIHSAKGAILCGGLFLAAYLLWMYQKWSKKSQKQAKASIKKRGQRQCEEVSTNIQPVDQKLDVLYKGVASYIAIICVVGLFIAFSY